jgi:hypothetical protein
MQQPQSDVAELLASLTSQVDQLRRELESTRTELAKAIADGIDRMSLEQKTLYDDFYKQIKDLRQP